MEKNNGEPINERSEAAKARAKRQLEKDPDYFKSIARRNKDRSYQIGNTSGFGRSRECAAECGRKGAVASAKAKDRLRSSRLRNSSGQGSRQDSDRVRGDEQ